MPLSPRGHRCRAPHCGHGAGRVRGTDRSLPLGVGGVVAAGAAAARRARPTCCSSCSTTSASRSSGASAPTSTPRTSTRWPPAACATRSFHTTALCSPTRACVLTGRNHHNVRDGPHRRPGHRLPRLRRPHPAVVRAAPGDAHAARLRRLRGRQVAPHARGRGAPRRPPRPLAARAGASSAGTASSPARRTSSSRRWSTTTTTSSHRRASRTATTSPPTWSTTPIECIEDLRNVDVDKPWFLYLATGACHSPHQSPRRVDRALPRPLRPGLGRVARGHAGPPEGGRPAARAHRAVAAARLGAGVGRPRPTTERRGLRALHGGVRRLPVAHRPRARPAARPAATRWASSTTRSWSCCPTTARRRRAARSARSTTPGCGTRCPRTVEEAAERLDEIGGPAHPQQLPVGLDGGRQHAVPPLEARDPRGRRGRPADRPLARRHRGAGRGAAPVRARHRHRCRRCST